MLIQVGLQDGKIMHQKVEDCVNEFFFLIFMYLFLLIVYTWLEYLQFQRVKINSAVGLLPSASISSETDLWHCAVCYLFSLYSSSSSVCLQLKGSLSSECLGSTENEAGLTFPTWKFIWQGNVSDLGPHEY